MSRPNTHKKSISFDPLWLENYLTEFFDQQPTFLRSASQFMRDRKIRNVSYAVMAAYSGLTVKQLSVRYSKTNTTLYGLIVSGLAEKEYTYINRELKIIHGEVDASRLRTEYSNTSPYGIANH